MLCVSSSTSFIRLLLLAAGGGHSHFLVHDDAVALRRVVDAVPHVGGRPLSARCRCSLSKPRLRSHMITISLSRSAMHPRSRRMCCSTRANCFSTSCACASARPRSRESAETPPQKRRNAKKQTRRNAAAKAHKRSRRSAETQKSKSATAQQGKGARKTAAKKDTRSGAYLAAAEHINADNL